MDMNEGVNAVYSRFNPTYFLRLRRTREEVRLTVVTGDVAKSSPESKPSFFDIDGVVGAAGLALVAGRS